MKKKYLLGPFLCTFAVWTVGNGTLALVPLYAMERGASAAGSGLFMAFAFLSLALGTFASGLLPGRFAHRRMLLVATGVLWIFLFLLNSRTTTLLAFAAGVGASYFLGGIVFAQAAVLTGLAAPAQERGTAFGILGMTNGLGGFVGGAGSGWLADRFGFVGLWEGATAAAVLIIVGGLLCVEVPVESRVEGPVEPVEPKEPAAQPAQGGGRSLPNSGAANGAANGAVSMALLLLLGVNLFLAFTNSTANLGRSLVMDERGFSKLTISLTQSVSGMVGLGLSFALGWLSDKVGRRWVLVGSCALIGAALLVLGFSRLLWQFYAFAALMAFLSVPTAIGPAYLMDVVPRESAARGVSFFQGVFWAGNIVGLAALGAAFERLGTVGPVLFSALFPAAGIVLLLLIRTRRGARAAGTGVA